MGAKFIIKIILKGVTGSSATDKKFKLSAAYHNSKITES